MNYSARIARLQRKLRRKKVDALLVSQPENRRYLSGYSATDHAINESSGYLLIPASGKGYLLTDFRFIQQAEEEVSDFQLDMYKRGPAAHLQKLLPKLGVATLAFESNFTLHSTAVAMEKSFRRKKIKVLPLTGLIEQMRVVKEEAEIDLIRASVRLNEQVFQAIYPTLSKQKTEIDIALALETSMRQHGAESASFDSIVASGANGAKPHAVPSTAMIAEHRSLTIDMGLILEGYCSDMTRNFVVGRADSRYLELHRLVRRAQLAGMNAVRAGVTAREVDKAARDIIADAGYAKYFGHSLGHGVGLAVHEEPRVSSHTRKKLKAGMIVTIEPGIYIPEWGGIRLENMVVVREDGCENLNTDTTWLDI